LVAFVCGQPAVFARDNQQRAAALVAIFWRSRRFVGVKQLFERGQFRVADALVLVDFFVVGCAPAAITLPLFARICPIATAVAFASLDALFFELAFRASLLLLGRLDLDLLAATLANDKPLLLATLLSLAIATFPFEPPLMLSLFPLAYPSKESLEPTAFPLPMTTFPFRKSLSLLFKALTFFPLAFFLATACITKFSAARFCLDLRAAARSLAGDDLGHGRIPSLPRFLSEPAGRASLMRCS
jgi:hypothetical protein